MSNTFRQTYRELTEEEKALVNEIKTKAEELEALIASAKPGRYASLALTSLETSVMWIVKHITG